MNVIFACVFLGLGFISLFGMLLTDILNWRIIAPYFDKVFTKHHVTLPYPMFYTFFERQGRGRTYGLALGLYYLYGLHYSKNRFLKSAIKGLDIYQYARTRDKVISTLSVLFMSILFVFSLIGLVLMLIGWNIPKHF